MFEESSAAFSSVWTLVTVEPLDVVVTHVFGVDVFF